MPQRNVFRYIDASIIFIISISSFFVYYSINYELCIDNICNSLVITRYWVTSSILYIIYGASAFITGIYVLKTKELPGIYGIAITLVVSTGFVLCSMIFFAIMRELKTFT